MTANLPQDFGKCESLFEVPPDSAQVGGVPDDRREAIKIDAREFPAVLARLKER